MSMTSKTYKTAKAFSKSKLQVAPPSNSKRKSDTMNTMFANLLIY